MYNKNLKTRRSMAARYASLLIIVALFVSTSCLAVKNSAITIKNASLSQQEQTYFLNALIKYHLSDEATEALHNGVTLTFNVELSIVEPRDWLWKKHHNKIILPYQIKFHTLAGTYQISNNTYRIQRNFSSLSTALHAMGVLNDIPMRAISPSKNIKRIGSIKAYLNIEALPLPMRPIAYITPGWYLQSNVYEWPLNP